MKSFDGKAQLQPIIFCVADGLFGSKVDVHGRETGGVLGRTELAAQLMMYFSLNPDIITLRVRCENPDQACKSVDILAALFLFKKRQLIVGAK